MIILTFVIAKNVPIRTYGTPELQYETIFIFSDITDFAVGFGPK